MTFDASFWIFVSFVLFVALVGRRFFKKIVWQLDQRSQQISQQIREASDLHEEAEFAYLQARSYLKKQKSRHEKELVALQQKIKLVKQGAKKKLLNLEKEFLDQIESRKKYLLEAHQAEVERKFSQELLKKVEYSLKNHLTAQDKKKYLMKELNGI